ncbi:MAG: phosphoglycerate dehydrogenase [Desulfobacterales bacterium]|nr:phosphoglycerate dehydrogenase [Desulfobacterales bacterium]
MNNQPKHTILITTASFGTTNALLIERLNQEGFCVETNPYRRKLTEEELTSLIEKYQPVVGIIAGVEPITRKVLQKATHLKVISRCGIGLDSVDLSAASEYGMIVTNTPDAPTIAVAELTLSMILSLLRRVHRSDSSIRKGGWERPMGNLLYGKTIGIIGCGRIGTYVAKLLSSFGCIVLAHDCFNPIKTDYYEQVTLDQLLNESDILTLHIPYTSENHHFIDREKLFLIKKGSVVINAARGGLIDEDALYEAINCNHIAGAALDSFEIEPYSGKLITLDNVLLTAHIGSYAIEARSMMETQSVDNLLSQLKKQQGI